MKIKILILCIFYLCSITDACKEHKTCKQCITDPSLCVWCTSIDPEYDKEPRCRSQGSFASSWCPGFLDKPENSSKMAEKNSNFTSNTKDVVVQIKPQMYTVKLRPGEPLDFDFSFQKAKNYPVDIYFLLDASHSMIGIKKQLFNQSEQIYTTMHSMTKNVKMGFGTFIDKNTMPYTISSVKNAAYSFRNRLNLTSDFTVFQASVNETKFGKNYDPPEGGFDALAQVLACDVGWRDDSRKIVLFLANSPQHGVGDGRIAGIIRPYDRKCHTNTNGIYTKELEFDYPSLTDINVLASNKKVTIIFAVEKATIFFQSLPGYIAGSIVADLKGTAVVTVLEQIYKEISTYIKLEVEVKSGHRNNYEIKFHPDCNSVDNHKHCKVETGETRDFKGIITLKEYYGQNTEDIDISVQGIKEKLTLKVDVIQCSCEAKQELSGHCHGQKLQCGTCICDDTTHGNRCMCKKGANTSSNESLCIAPKTIEPGTTSDDLCSGEGECECGLCKCNKGRNGTFCQCNLRSCPGFGSDAVCGGHGECSCTGDSESKAVCTCHRGWNLKPGAEYLGCVCEDIASMCFDNTQTVCNNRGNCTCNSCDCQPIPDWDKRIEQDSLCNIKPCPSCHSMQCSAVRKCVHCRLNSEHCYGECTGVFLHDKIYDVLPSNLSSEWQLCQNEKLESGCYTKFAYQYDDKMYRILLIMQKDADCAENYYKFGGIILGTVLLVGILTLLAWKCMTRYQDIKEYKKFEAEHKEDLNAPCANPLYDEPRTFRNPAFKKSFS